MIDLNLSAFSDLTLSEWSLSKRLLRGKPFNILPPIKFIYDDPDKEAYIEKAAQVTISEYLINLALFCADTGWGGRGNALYIFPATPQISDFSNARIETVIQDSAYLRYKRQLIKQRTGFVPTNNVQLKQLDKGFIYLRGSNSRTQIISVDADIVIFDEVDEMLEGTIEAGKKRAGSAKYPYFRGASTPKYPKTGIDALIEKSDRKVWMVKCTRCDRYQDLARLQEVIFELPKHQIGRLQVDPGPLGTHSHIGSRFYVACPACKHVLNVWNGEWVPTYTDNPSWGGYHIPKLISDHLDFEEISKKNEDEKNGKLTEVQTQEFWNSDLGLPRAPQGSQLSYQELLACSDNTPEDYYFKTREDRDWISWIPEEYNIDAAYIGIDVAPRRCHITAIGFPAHNPSLRKLTSENNPVLLMCGSIALTENKTDGAELDPLMYKWKVLRGVIDRMPEYRMAAAFRNRFRGRIYTCSYIKWKNKPNITHEYNYDDGTVNAGRTETLDVVYDTIRTRKLILPRNVKMIGGNVNIRGFGQFAQHLMNNTRITDKDTNEVIYDEGGAEDHLSHAANYAFIAAQYGQIIQEEIPGWMVPDSVDSTLAQASQQTVGVNLFMQLGLTSTGKKSNAREEPRYNLDLDRWHILRGNQGSGSGGFHGY